MKTRTLLTLLCLLCISQQSPSQDENRALLRRKVAAAIEKTAAALDGVMGVAIKDLTTGEELLVNAELVFPTGSSIKIPILIELHKQAAAGGYELSERHWIERPAKVGGSGVLLHFSEHGSQLSLHDIAVLMIVLSDNTATNMLIDRVGMTNVNRMLDELGLGEIRLRRKMIDQAASGRGEENTATPRAAMLLMEKLFRGDIGRPAVAEDVVRMLKLPKGGSIPRLLPGEVPVANKPGGIEGASCDWGIVYAPNRPYAIAVMTNYIGQGAEDAIAAVSKLAYDYFARLSRSTPYGARVPAELLGVKE